MGRAGVPLQQLRASLLAALPVLGLLAVLTGLLGMHGLGPAVGAHPVAAAASHASSAAHHPAAAAEPSTCCPAHQEAASAPATEPGLTATALVPTGSRPHAPPAGGHVGQLCLAVLGATVFLLPLLLARARARLPVPTPPLPPRAVAAGARRFSPAPSLAVLSVLRI